MISRPFYKWIIWVLSALYLFYKYALEVSPSVMTGPLMAAFDADAASLGNLAACYFYAYLVMQIPAGILIDRFGPRRVTTLAILFCSAGSLLFAFAETIGVACAARFLTGGGGAFAAISCLKLIANWYPKRRFAFMAGLMMSVGMLGAVGGQAPLARFIEAFGWRASLEILAYAGFGLALLFLLLIRNRAPQKQEAPTSTGDLGQQMKAIFRSKQAWILSLYSGLAFAPITFFGGLWGVPFLQVSYALPGWVAAKAISTIFIGFGVGAPLAGYLSDALRSRKKIMFIGTTGALIAGTLVLYAPLTLSLLYTLLFFFGFFLSAFLLCFTMIREISSFAVAATAVGFMNAFDALIGSISDPLTGWFLDLNWTGQMEGGAPIFPLSAYKLAFLSLPIYLLVALLLLFWLRETYKKEHYPAELP